ncbi:hypothetical protein [Nonomuraea sp. NPDC049158]|uniref:hypothetical protein n=1 Tax=Nonomuraea sp. NPDC049158 TaxID=3155649 RepID=UPI0034052F32
MLRNPFDGLDALEPAPGLAAIAGEAVLYGACLGLAGLVGGTRGLAPRFAIRWCRSRSVT